MKKSLLLFLAFLALGQFAQSQVPKLVKDINTVPYSGSPNTYVATDSLLYFRATSADYGQELWAFNGQTAWMVKDINPGLVSSNPGEGVMMNGIYYFPAADATSGIELWRTDGTEAGTYQVKDIYPGAGSASIAKLTASNNALYFLAINGVNGAELWRSDGTAMGTRMMQEFAAGTTSAPITQLWTYKDTLYFLGSNNLYGYEMYKADATDTGYALVKDIRPGTGSGMTYPPTIFNGFMYFTGNDGTNGADLWISDGTESGTYMIKDHPGSLSPAELTVVGDKLYFSAYSSAGNELWMTTGDTNIFMVKDLDPGSFSSNPTQLTAAGNKLFFVAEVDNGKELYVSDGTSAGTKLTRDLYPIQTDAFIAYITAIDTVVYFRAHSSPNYQDYELYRSDGTTFGTRRVKDITPGSDASDINFLINYKNKLYFSVTDPTLGKEFWTSDGTDTGTKVLIDLYTGNTGSSISNIGIYPGGVLFDPMVQGIGREPWITNGDSGGTSLLSDLGSGYQSSNPKNFKLLNGYTFFETSASNATSTREMRYYDGTTLNSIRYSNFYGIAGNATWYKGKMYSTWQSSSASLSNFLYSYTLGNSSASRVKTINPSNLGDDVENLIVFNDMLYFSAEDVNYGNELWMSDGTSSGTVQVKDIRSGSTDASPRNFTILDSVMFFTANNGTNGIELWSTDGTSIGTQLFKDIRSGGASASPANLLVAFNKLFFTANDGINGVELWVSDGTSNGTQMVKDIWPGIGGSVPGNLVAAGNWIYFTATDSLNGLELWKTDGTALGTEMVKAIYPGMGGAEITEIIAVRDQIYFNANDSLHGKEIWKSDGSTSGTVLVTDLYPGTRGSNAKLFTLYGDSLYFAAEHPSYGEELWYMYTNCMRAGFEVSATCVNQEIQMLDRTDSLQETGLSYTWDFGDGSTGMGLNPMHTYADTGLYQIQLEVTSAGGCSTSVQSSVRVYDVPSPNFAVDADTQCYIGNQFAFTNLTSNQNSGMKYTWDFGDAKSDTATNPNHTYTSVNTFTVWLKATQSGACADSVSLNVVTINAPSAPLITGKSVSTNQQDTFSITPNAGSTYTWTVQGGTILSGAGTEQIIVKWNVRPANVSVKVKETNAYGCSSNDRTLNIQLQFGVGISDPSLASMELYPNPANQVLELRFSDAVQGAVSLLNNLGQVVYSQSMSGNASRLDIGHLAPGAYVLRIQTEKGIKEEKVLINR
ncbi:MAG: PKD domain-containing protein [Bacteroidetes bacterium]|nr:MAG: PKD domain-containing protein [Bacteroidota bacterium]